MKLRRPGTLRPTMTLWRHITLRISNTLKLLILKGSKGGVQGVLKDIHFYTMQYRLYLPCLLKCFSFQINQVSLSFFILRITLHLSHLVIILFISSTFTFQLPSFLCLLYSSLDIFFALFQMIHIELDSLRVNNTFSWKTYNINQVDRKCTKVSELKREINHLKNFFLSWTKFGFKFFSSIF